MIIVIGKKDKKMLKDIRRYLVICKNRYLSIHGPINNDFVYFINRLSKILHINDKI